MKIKLSILFLFLATNLFSQDYKFGVSYHQNFCSQVYQFTPDNIEISRNLIRYGINAFVERNLGDDFSLRGVIGYQQKGGSIGTLVLIGNGFASSTNSGDFFKFDFMTLETNFVFHPFNYVGVKPFILSGLGYDFLQKKEYNRDGDLLVWQQIPSTVLDNSRKSILSLKLGTGIRVKNILGLGISANVDVRPILKDDLVHVRHFVWSIDASLFLSSIFRNKK